MLLFSKAPKHLAYFTSCQLILRSWLSSMKFILDNSTLQGNFFFFLVTLVKPFINEMCIKSQSGLISLL